MKKRTWAGLLVAALCATSALAVQEGEPAPDFRAPSTSGSELGLSDFSGKWLVLYFYPKAFTPGCTAEACSLRDGYAAIIDSGAQILGVSVDTLDTQKKFKAEYHLPFDLLADESGVVTKTFGAEGMIGRMSRRVTFIISPEGKIARAIESVKSAEHDAQVLAALRELQAKPE